MIIEFTNGQEITIGNIVDNELKLISPLKGVYQHVEALILITDVVGTGIQFTTGEEIKASSYKYQIGDKFIMTFFPDKNNLHCQSDNINDKFVITV